MSQAPSVSDLGLCQHLSLMIWPAVTMATHLQTPEAQPAAWIVCLNVHTHLHIATHTSTACSLSTVKVHRTHTSHHHRILKLSGTGQLTTPHDIKFVTVDNHALLKHHWDQRTFTSSKPACQAQNPKSCLLYTSDAADELTRVDLGGRRIIKKK